MVLVSKWTGGGAHAVRSGTPAEADPAAAASPSATPRATIQRCNILFMQDSSAAPSTAGGGARDRPATRHQRVEAARPVWSRRAGPASGPSYHFIGGSRPNRTRKARAREAE